MANRKTYKVTVARDGDWWLVKVPAISRATQARRLDQVEAMARDLIALIEDVPATSFDVAVESNLDARNREIVAQAIESRYRAKLAQVEASNAIRAAAHTLTKEAGLTVRDVGALLDVSHQRIAQLLDESIEELAGGKIAVRRVAPAVRSPAASHDNRVWVAKKAATGTHSKGSARKHA